MMEIHSIRIYLQIFLTISGFSIIYFNLPVNNYNGNNKYVLINIITIKIYVLNNIIIINRCISWSKSLIFFKLCVINKNT